MLIETTDLKAGDSLVMRAGEVWEMTSVHAPKGFWGKILGMFFAPQEKLTVRIERIVVTDGVPCVSLYVMGVSS